jgi:hypothetical protein
MDLFSAAISVPTGDTSFPNSPSTDTVPGGGGHSENLFDFDLTDIMSIIPTSCKMPAQNNDFFGYDDVGINTESSFDLDGFDFEGLEPKLEGSPMPNQSEDELYADSPMVPSAAEESGASDESDEAIDNRWYKIFPMEALRLPRKEFTKWRQSHKNGAVRQLPSRDSKRLSAIRRVILARVYAEKARMKKGQEAESMKGHLTRLKDENVALRQRIRQLETMLLQIRRQAGY